MPIKIWLVRAKSVFIGAFRVRRTPKVRTPLESTLLAEEGSPAAKPRFRHFDLVEIVGIDL